MKHRRLGQALVEFALVAPVAMLMIGATVDMGRGMVLFALLQGASRDTARQAALGYYSGSNSLPPDCTALTTPCSLTSLVQGAHLLDPLGTSVVYADSASISAAPAAYGTYLANADPTQPGTITLAGGTNPNTVYVFIYELDSTPGNPTPRWSCPTCAAANGAAVRTGGHQRTVVDLKLKWQPVMARFLGIPTVITFDAQTVVRMEF
ncbi:MAG TPA: TadE family protein [Candidatus Dormibacteraeota bacterium]|nr:TadE family protein [Candidatus Dormibacteraeota bacterium]